MERLSSERFSWTISKSQIGLTVVVYDHQLPRSKTFFQAGDIVVEQMEEHMKSLTDELLEGFWPRDRVKKVKKPVAETSDMSADGIQIPAIREIVPSTVAESNPKEE